MAGQTSSGLENYPGRRAFSWRCQVTKANSLEKRFPALCEEGVESFQEAKIGVESDFGRGCVGSFLGVLSLNRLGYGGRFHREELGV